MIAISTTTLLCLLNSAGINSVEIQSPVWMKSRLLLIVSKWGRNLEYVWITVDELISDKNLWNSSQFLFKNLISDFWILYEELKKEVYYLVIKETFEIFLLSITVGRSHLEGIKQTLINQYLYFKSKNFLK